MKIPRILIVLAMLLTASIVMAQPIMPVGNLNPPVPPAVEFLHTGLETYAYLIYPPEQASCSQGGFELLDVNMYLELTPGQVPVSFHAAGGLIQADWDHSIGQFVPGQPLCEGPQFFFHFDEPGLYTITVPMDLTCGCQIFDEHYFLTLEYLDPFEANLPTDGQPAPGIVYNDKGAGWVDMIGLGKTAGGKVIIWGDLVCCDPVANAEGSWGGIKTLYR